MDTIIKAIVFLPLIGALIAGLGGGAIGAKASEYITSGFMIIAAVKASEGVAYRYPVNLRLIK